MRHLIATLAFASIAAAAPVSADEIGQDLYMQYCATCHGTDAKGAGPLAEHMITAIPDLTTLAERNPKAKGEFPMLDVIHIVDGRTGLRAHGGPMPVYGAIFAAEGADREKWGEVMYTRGRVMSLVYYLESLQQPS